MERDIDRFAKVFPTRVGMNRGWLKSGKVDKCVPHARGDEPKADQAAFAKLLVFPTRVGMNRYSGPAPLHVK